MAPASAKTRIFRVCGKEEEEGEGEGEDEEGEGEEEDEEEEATEKLNYGTDPCPLSSLM